MAGAIENASEHDDLVGKGICRSPYTISVHVPRPGLASKEELLASVPYVRYKPYLEAPARDLISAGFVEIVPTTPTAEGVVPSGIDLCHYDVVIDARNEDELRRKIGHLPELFLRRDNDVYGR